MQALGANAGKARALIEADQLVSSPVEEHDFAGACGDADEVGGGFEGCREAGAHAFHATFLGDVAVHGSGLDELAIGRARGRAPPAHHALARPGNEHGLEPLDCLATIDASGHVEVVTAVLRCDQIGRPELPGLFHGVAQRAQPGAVGVRDPAGGVGRADQLGCLVQQVEELGFARGARLRIALRVVARGGLNTLWMLRHQ